MAGRPIEKGGPEASAHREAARRWYQRLTAAGKRKYVEQRDPQKQREADNRRHARSREIRNLRNAENKDPQKVAARKTAAESVPLGRACENCGARTNLERHHPDHRYPTRVVTLCSKCNSRETSQYRGVRKD